MVELLPLSACDPGAIENLLDAAFGTDRKSRTAYLLRDGTACMPALSFGLLSSTHLIGSIQCWPVLIEASDGDSAAMVLVGPVAVAPELQGLGHGQALMQAMVDAAMLEGNPPMVMIGDAEYYGRFGFSAAETAGWNLPGPFEQNRLLLRNEGDYILPLTGMIGPDIGD
ncbi:GNAT family N-acetyltransferase [Sphingorhabdus arenilitoris]|uniref:GNAT family N-acetyltransferase n=1 Tax=Sphingorhabdus arenilitoris TaxID=1490041 RepID=A0ABV8RHH1_9SPHN